MKLDTSPHLNSLLYKKEKPHKMLRSFNLKSSGELEIIWEHHFFFSLLLFSHEVLPENRSTKDRRICNEDEHISLPFCLGLFNNFPLIIYKILPTLTSSPTISLLSPRTSFLTPKLHPPASVSFVWNVQPFINFIHQTPIYPLTPYYFFLQCHIFLH